MLCMGDRYPGVFFWKSHWGQKIRWKPLQPISILWLSWRRSTERWAGFYGVNTLPYNAIPPLTTLQPHDFLFLLEMCLQFSVIILRHPRPPTKQWIGAKQRFCRGIIELPSLLEILYAQKQPPLPEKDIKNKKKMCQAQSFQNFQDPPFLPCLPNYPFAIIGAWY